MKPQQAAHLRMLESLPRRTHEWRPIRAAWGMKRSPVENDDLRAQLLEADAAGKSRQQMRAMFHISQHTIHKLIGKKQR